MIDYAEFTVGSTVLQRITGDQMYLMNELKQKKKRQTAQAGTTGMSAMHRVVSSDGNWMNPWSVNTLHPDVPGTVATDDGYPGAGPWSRILHENSELPGALSTAGGVNIREQTTEYHIPLSFFFTDSPGKYFPMAALHGVNDIRVTLRLRSLEELMIISPMYNASTPLSKLSIGVPKFAGGVFKHFRLRAHYYALSGPEATALASKEQVRLIEEWQHLREIKTFKCTELGRAHKVDIDLNFLHPVKELIFVLRRASEMNSDVSTVPYITDAQQGPATKNYFAFHGDPAEGDPNIDGVSNTCGHNDQSANAYKINLDVNNIKLKLNGTERHNAISDGVKRDYLSDMVVGRQRSMFTNNDHNRTICNMKQKSRTNGLDGLMVDRAALQLQKMHDSKSIFVYPLCIDAEGDNPSGSVNFSKVSHAKLSFDVTAFSGTASADVDTEFYIDVYAVSYNWLQIRDGRALVSFA
jgi:hypothetical protein